MASDLRLQHVPPVEKSETVNRLTSPSDHSCTRNVSFLV